MPEIKQKEIRAQLETNSPEQPKVCDMNKALGIGLLVVGIVLMIFGINASESFGSEVSRFFTGAPTDKSIWLLIGGILSVIVGLFMTLGRSVRT